MAKKKKKSQKINKIVNKMTRHQSHNKTRLQLKIDSIEFSFPILIEYAGFRSLSLSVYFFPPFNHTPDELSIRICGLYVRTYVYRVILCVGYMCYVLFLFFFFFCAESTSLRYADISWHAQIQIKTSKVSTTHRKLVRYANEIACVSQFSFTSLSYTRRYYTWLVFCLPFCSWGFFFLYFFLFVRSFFKRILMVEHG